ncbi:ABC transporter substrate-binding protein [Desulfogranum mediterraneum]|uniref:ABC transporter substrate-binding protein n=1 Tax=Desulfogranum mediterraneum TaxID=160661 RepID=UPI001E46863B|nr:ABC transporter substrate-binding protein [Desulfogranum mediterraneum]
MRTRPDLAGPRRAMTSAPPLASALTLLLAVLLLVSLPPARAAFITDSDQQTLVFAQPFSRIISLYPAHTRNLVDMGATEAIVAVGRSDELLPGLPRVHFRDDPERLIALRPDLVLIRPMISRSYPQLVQRLRRSNIQVVSLQPADMAELFAYWQKLGRLSGCELGAAELSRSFSSRLAEFHQQLSQIPQEERKKVYFEAIHRRMKTFASTSMAIFALETAGGINVADDALQVRSTNIAAYSKERILAKADQIQVFLAQQGRMNPVTRAEILNEPGFAMIRAVREKEVYLIDEKLVSRPTMGLLDGAAIIMELLYPKAPLQEGLTP